MNEREFEDIICKYPELIEDSLSFKGRQVTVRGKRVDVLFKDRHGYTLIVELKRGTVLRRDVSQLLDYEGEFLSDDDPKVRVMLVGNRVPENLRRALDNHGFEWKELSIAFLRKFLEEHNDIPLFQSLSAAGERIEKPPGMGADTAGVPPATEGSMPKEGDTFKGRVNDLCLDDAQGWRRRDIWFFKHEINSQAKLEYPKPRARIVLIDTDGDRYELNFSKPDLRDRICLGTPSQLKPWYQKKGFNYRGVDPDTRVYFRYTGRGHEFVILTEEEYRSDSSKRD
jgi:hypothetical protein